MHIHDVTICDFKTPGDHGVALSQYTLLTGPNGAGKTAMIQALQFGVLGMIPGQPRTPGDLLRLFAADPDAGFRVHVGLGDAGSISRTVKPTGKGGASVGIAINGARLSKSAADRKLGGMMPNPGVIDLTAFLELSGKAQAATILTLAGTAPEALDTLTTQVDDTSERLNALVAKRRRQEAALVELTSARADLPTPAGTLAECQGGIVTDAASLKDLNEQRREAVAGGERVRGFCDARDRLAARYTQHEKTRPDAHPTQIAEWNQQAADLELEADSLVTRREAVAAGEQVRAYVAARESVNPLPVPTGGAGASVAVEVTPANDHRQIEAPVPAGSVDEVFATVRTVVLDGLCPQCRRWAGVMLAQIEHALKWKGA